VLEHQRKEQQQIDNKSYHHDEQEFPAWVFFDLAAENVQQDCDGEKDGHVQGAQVLLAEVVGLLNKHGLQRGPARPHRVDHRVSCVGGGVYCPLVYHLSHFSNNSF
jgi:hypothetical protein